MQKGILAVRGIVGRIAEYQAVVLSVEHYWQEIALPVFFGFAYTIFHRQVEVD
jgi:hypothetical protein